MVAENPVTGHNRGSRAFSNRCFPQNGRKWSLRTFALTYQCYPHTGFKVDVFVLDPSDPFNQSSFNRARSTQINQDISQLFRLDTPEDVILHKLKWYKAGSGTSDKQWNDILGIFKVQGITNLDRFYLKLWATQLAVADLLVKAIQEASNN